MKDELGPFISHAREQGVDHSTIRLLLLSAGWKDRDISEAVAAQALGMPVPRPPDRGGAREAFLYLLTFIALYSTVISTVVLFFTYFEILFPDPKTVVSEHYVLSMIRGWLAALVVSLNCAHISTPRVTADMTSHGITPQDGTVSCST
jgi:hypothetical protein